jgi:E3 ubiquitin-protein ligase UBR4
MDGKFHLDSGGGGPESNLKLLPYLIQSTLYILNQTKQYDVYIELIEKLCQFETYSVDSACAVQGPLFAIVACLMVNGRGKWNSIRFKMLENLILMSHVRESSLNPKSHFTEKERLPLPFTKVVGY